MFSFQGASSSKSNPQLSFWNLHFKTPLCLCFSSQIKTRLRWAFDLFWSSTFEFLFQETQWSINSLMFQSISWWRVPGSNRWPPACKAGALPAELTPHIVKTKSTFFVLKYSLSKLHCVFVSPPQIKPASLSFDLAPWEFGSGGPKWTRTIDLTIISRVL